MIKTKTKKSSYVFTNLPGTMRRALLCPDCGERLIQEDIEQYSSCPYCGKSLSFTADIEDFIVGPFIDPWHMSNNRVLPEPFLLDGE